MKILALLISALFIATITFGQPALPAVSKVYGEIKANKNVYEKLKTDYKIANPQSAIIEMKMIIGGGDIIVSEWHTYRSDEGKRLHADWPDDRAFTVFIVTTPASQEGVTYKLPLVVEYTRIQNSVLQNNWSYHSWRFDTPYSASGGKEDAQFEQLFIQELSKITGTKSEGSIPPPDALEKVCSIRKIEKSSREDIRELKYGNADFFTRTYKITCASIEYTNSENAVTEAFYPNSTAYLTVRFRRTKSDGKTGNWTFETFEGGFSSYLEKGEPNEDKSLYARIEDIGFKAIYQKDPMIKKTPVNSQMYKDQFSKNVSEALYNFATGVAGSEAAFKKYLDPNKPDLIEQFRSYFLELKNKCVYIGYGLSDPKEALVVQLSVNSSNPENPKVYFRIKAERPAMSKEKTLKSTYKAAGISKAAMANMDGYFHADQNTTLRAIYLNGEIYISEAPVLSSPIPF